uniref:Uncharacterized protein n=1 Tax=Physcomitrium patens TaxID=3218 RepID=A0A2K1IP45_PHYPA|nr:hypothetical protein PHYPA_027367 [Physcomitrium patens]
MVIHCNNQLALVLVDIIKFHSRTKHIAILYYFIQQ